MQNLKTYINDILGTKIDPTPVPAAEQERLPFYIREAYKLYFALLFNQPLVLATLKEGNAFTNMQIEKHLHLLRQNMDKKVALVSDDMTAINRRRLIDRGVNFIVPGKQLFLPEFLMDLKEDFNNRNKKDKKKALLPSGQFILLYHILHRNERVQLTDLSFKEIAGKIGYSPMAITKATEDLKDHELCIVTGGKEKYIRFDQERNTLWDKAKPYLINPVLKRVYIDKKPNAPMLASNLTALPEYSDINPGGQAYYAIERTIFYGLQKSGGLINENEEEGPYCLEVWKYDPIKLSEGISREGNVDPLSLYLSLKVNPDERVEMALEQIINKYIW